jgi:hypothetical protein
MLRRKYISEYVSSNDEKQGFYDVILRFRLVPSHPKMFSGGIYWGILLRKACGTESQRAC